LRFPRLSWGVTFGRRIPTRAGNPPDGSTNFAAQHMPCGDPVIPPVSVLFQERDTPWTVHSTPPSTTFRRSVPQPQIRDQLPVLLQVVPANVVQQPTALPYHLQQPPSRMVILRMTLEMPRQIVDPLRQERHLPPGG